VVAYIYYVRDFAVAAGDGIPTLVRSEFNLGPGGLEHQPPVPLIEGVDGLWVELGVDDVSITGEPVNNAVAVAWEDPETKRRARNRGDGIPDGNFVRCTDAGPCTLNQLMNVTAVKVYVLARSREATRGYTDTKTYSVGAAGVIPAFNDGFKRHVYSTTVRLPNVSGRRIRPGVEPVAGEEEEEIILPGDPVDPVDPLPPVEPEVL
jgi:type IV pilus assembly protein PilW